MCKFMSKLIHKLICNEKKSDSSDPNSKEADISNANSIEESGSPTTNSNSLNEQAKSVQYKFILELADRIWNREVERENTLIQQASQMQAAFSFVIAGLFMALPVIMDNKGVLSDNWILCFTAVITFCLLLSLFFASLASKRYKQEEWKSIETTEYEILHDPNWKSILSEYGRYKTLVYLMGKMQKSKAETNAKRSRLIMLSIKSFIASIVVIGISFAISFCILFF